MLFDKIFFAERKEYQYKSRRLYSIINLFICIFFFCPFVFAQSSIDHIFFGDNRANLPGPVVLDSVFNENPAKSADIVHNSFSYSVLFLPGASYQNNSHIGYHYGVCIPNFSLINIAENTVGKESNNSNLSLYKEILGMQLGLSTQNFFPSSLFSLAAGAGIYRLGTTNLVSGNSASTIAMDLGFTAQTAGFVWEIVLKNIMNSTDGNLSFFGSDFDCIAKINAKLLLDIECCLTFATANGYDLFDSPYSADDRIDFYAGLRLMRFFFSNTLRPAVELGCYFDFSNTAFPIPLIKYGISVSYGLPDMPFGEKKPDTANVFRNIVNNSATTTASLLHNLYLNFGFRMTVDNSGQTLQSSGSVFSLGLTKYF